MLSNSSALNDDDIVLLKAAQIFHFGSSPLKSEPLRSNLYQAIDLAAENGAIISYAPRIHPADWQMRNEALRILRSPIVAADVVQVLPDELPFLTGESLPEAAADVLADHGVRLILVMLEGGVLLRFGREQRKIPIEGICDCEMFLGTVLRRIADVKRPLRQISTDDIMKWVESITVFSCK